MASERSHAADFNKEFNMLVLTKPASMAMAVALGVAFGVPFSIPALSDPASSYAAMQTPAAASELHKGDLVRIRSGGPLMTVTAVQGDKVTCTWTNWDGQPMSESFPIAVLGVPVTTTPPQDPHTEQVE
jgi:uncharacterized protein YodC (DUF2158 family)